MPAINISGVIAVVGAGTMGSGIAQLAAAAGHEVLVYDALDGAAARGKTRIAAALARRVATGKMQQSDCDALLGRLTVADDASQLAGAALVIEAIVEDLDVKRRVFAALEEVVSPDAILATNTSSVSITAIARDLKHPDRLVGMHFFNPATVMKLVEVISGLGTSPAVAEVVFATAQAWGKAAVHAKSTPGFIVNRVARPYYAEALRLCEEQVADPATIDALLTDGAGFRMGPFALMDLIGHDVNYAVTRSVYDAYFQEPRFRPSNLQLELVNAGRLGRKSGQGFYDYRDDAAKPRPRSETSPRDAATLSQFVPGVRAIVDGVLLMPTDGRTALMLAAQEQGPVIVYDLIDPAGPGTRVGFAASPDVSQAALDSFVATLAAQGTKATRLPDWPGLVAMRVIAMLANEAYEAVMQGVASHADVDAAMRYGVNYPKGPIQWAGEIGLVRILQVLDAIHHLTGDPRYRASLALRLAATAPGI
ncbi:3-hydroxyacyl-CoA dehydrogenase [Devosia sp. A369]